jgi:hypothetical protein
MAFLTRYTEDPSTPPVGSALRDLLLRAAVPAVGVWVVVVGLGLLIKGPLGDLTSEDAISKDVQGTRTATWDAVTLVWSHIGNTEIVITVCVLAVGAIWWRTHQWWLAVVPGIAIALQATVFVIATAVVGRPRPPVAHLDPAPPAGRAPVAAPPGHDRVSTDPGARGVGSPLPRHAPPERHPRRRCERPGLRAACLGLPAPDGFQASVCRRRQHVSQRCLVRHMVHERQNRLRRRSSGGRPSSSKTVRTHPFKRSDPTVARCRP